MQEFKLRYPAEFFGTHDQAVRNAIQAADAHTVASGCDSYYRELWVQFADDVDPEAVLRAAAAVVAIYDFTEEVPQ